MLGYKIERAGPDGVLGHADDAMTRGVNSVQLDHPGRFLLALLRFVTVRGGLGVD